MYYITERKLPSGTCFEKKYIAEDGSSYISKIHIRTANVTLEDIHYTYLYNSDMSLISPVFHFINFELQNTSPNHRTMAINALKLLYSFLELYSLDIKSLTKNDIQNLIIFLEGTSKRGTLYNLNLSTQRSGATINNYFAIYRNYVAYLGYNDSAFLTKSTRKKTIVFPASETSIDIETYAIRMKTYKPEISAPRYISPENFKSILTVIRQEYSIREECIVRLAFECGLRIGEILGLTNEDIVEKNGTTYLYIRNRCSDAADQLAKTCMNIVNPKQYTSSNYNKKGFGYHLISINHHLADKLIDYLNTYHANYNAKFQYNYTTYNIADSVTSDQSDNFYIFINSLGKPLTANLWNKKLREIFKKSGIMVDKGTKETNLNHRFRHGFAMYMIKYKSVDMFRLKELLRHRSVRSVEHYYRPTDEDIVAIKTEFIDSIYDIIPELSN